jgi:hypothetical protein
MSRYVVRLSASQSTDAQGRVVRTLYAVDNFGGLWVLRPDAADAEWESLPGLPQDNISRNFFDDADE